MVLTNGKLGRICKKCKSKYEPEGKYQELCKKCKKEGLVKRNIKRIKSLKRNIKLRKELKNEM